MAWLQVVLLSSVFLVLPAASSTSGGFLKRRDAFQFSPGVSLDASVAQKMSIEIAVGAYDLVVAADTPTSTTLSNFTQLAEIDARPSPHQRIAEMETAPSKEPLGELELLAVLRVAISFFQHPKNRHLPDACIRYTFAVDFSAGIERALDHMVQKRRRSMQAGLKELAATIDDLFSSMEQLIGVCELSVGAKAFRQSANTLKTLTSSVDVGYGTHIKDNALKSLIVGHVDIHLELLDFMSAWKLRSQTNAGVPLGKLMQKLLSITGHDEL